jgi:plasmid stabilization system protein ParE
MKVIWMPLAKMALKEKGDYIRKEFGKNRKNKFIQEVRESSRLIGQNPYLGKVEPILSDVTSTYRSLVVNRINKIVYRVMDNQIEISDFWDCRQAPETLADRVG